MPQSLSQRQLGKNLGLPPKLNGLKRCFDWLEKVCGILAEAISEGEEAKYVIVEIGINVNFNLSTLPVKLWKTATSLKEILGRVINRDSFICSLLENFKSYYQTFRKGRFDFVIDEWKRLSCILGCKVQILNHEEGFECLAEDIYENGCLIVRWWEIATSLFFSILRLQGYLQELFPFL